LKNNGEEILEAPETRQFLEEIVGDEGMCVVNALLDKKMTDEDLAEGVGLKLNIVRKVLYKLYDYRLASYVRTKDKEIGWYVYTWSMDLNRVSALLEKRKQRVLRELEAKLEFEQEHVFFICKNENIKVPFHIASECNFRCPHCNGVMEHADNQELITSLEEEILKLHQEICNV